MANFVHILLRVLAGIAGALLLYVAFFLYEDEEARIQNRLEQLWRRIDALHGVAISIEAAFLRTATNTTSRILDSLFGHKLLSLRFVAISVAFSLASVLVFVVLLGDMSAAVRGYGIACAVLLVIFGCLSARIRNSIYDLVLVIAAVWLTSWAIGMTSPSGVEAYEVPLNAATGVFLDMCFVMFFRWTLKKIANISKLWVISLWLVTVSAVTILFALPAVLSDRHFYTTMRRVTGTSEAARRFVVVVMQASMSNLFDALCLLLLIMVIAALLIHRLVWPIIKRPVYAANRKQLIKNTKLLGALGTMLLLYAFPNNALVNWITHFLPNLKGG